MKRKLTFPLLMGAMAVASMGVVATSCKDYDEDMYNQLYSQFSKDNTLLRSDLTDMVNQAKDALQSQIDALKIQLQNIKSCNCDDPNSPINIKLKELEEKLTKQIADLEDTISNMPTKTDVEDLLKQLTDLNSDFNDTKVEMDALQKQVEDLQKLVADLQDKVDSMSDIDIDKIKQALEEFINNAVSDKFTQIEKDLSEILSRLDAVEESVLEAAQEAKNALKDAQDALAQAGDNAAAIEAANKNIADLEARIKELEDYQSTIQGLIDDAIKNLRDEFDGKIANFITGEDLNSKLANYYTKSEVDAKFLTIENALKQVTTMATGILIQQTFNPVFGTVNVPLDVNSNVLMVYHGTNSAPTGAFEFPYFGSANEFNAGNPDILNASDENFLRNNNMFPQTFSVDGELFNEVEGNAGTLYVTINPANANFEGTQLTIVNSRDEESGMKLTPLKKSDEELKFGYTRSSANNGFYEAQATLTRENIGKVKADIEPGLKNAMKEVLVDLRDRTNPVKDLAQAAYKVYKTMDGILPANGLKLEQTVNGETRYVYSTYGLATTTMRPLSYAFLAGKDFSIKRHFSPFDEFDFDDLHMDPITLDIDGSKIHIEFTNISLSDDGTSITVVIPAIEVTDEYGNVIGTTEETTVNVTDLQDFFDALADQLNPKFKDILNEAIESAINQLSDQINDQMDKITGPINDMIGDLTDNLDRVNSIVRRVNNYMSRVNSLISRVNHYLSDLNHYLQVCMLYQGKDGALHIMSQNREVPSQFVFGSGNAIRIIPTSYTAEVIAPSFKKYVVVTNAFKDGKSAQVDGGELLDAVRYANAAPDFNVVFRGDIYSIGFQPSQSITDVTYEITYSSVDYHGRTSTNKYYVHVK